MAWTPLSHWIREHKWNFLPKASIQWENILLNCGHPSKLTKMPPNPQGHMPEIKDYCSTLAASKLIILFLQMLKFSKILFLKNNFLWRKVKNLLKYFISNMKSSNLKKLFKRHALKLPSYSCNSLHYINVRNWFLW